MVVAVAHHVVAEARHAAVAHRVVAAPGKLRAIGAMVSSARGHLTSLAVDRPLDEVPLVAVAVQGAVVEAEAAHGVAVPAAVAVPVPVPVPEVAAVQQALPPRAA